MAGNIKGITIEFNGDTTRLDRALRDVKNSTKDIDSELRKVTQSLKFNPGNTDLLRQKQELLGQKIKQTESNLRDLKDMQSQVASDPSQGKNSAAYRELQREIIKSENQLKKFNAEQKKLQAALSPLGQFSSKMKDVGTKLEAAGQKMKAVSAAGAAVVASLGAVSYKAASAADDINTLSKVTGIGTEDLQMYSLAANQVDVSTESVARANVKLKKTMQSAADGTGASAEAFESLGVNVTDSNGNLRDSNAVFTDLLSALGSMENETERDALAMQLLGKSASELNPLIEDGGETYQRMGELFAKYDLSLVDQETLDKANEFKDSIDDIKSIGTLALQTVGAELAGYLAPALEKVVDIVGRIAGWIAQLDPSLLAIIGTIAAVMAVIAPLLIGVGKIAFAISSITGLLSTLGVGIGALSAGALLPIIGVIAAVVAAGVLLYKNWDKVKAFAIKLKDGVVNAFNQLKTRVVSIFNAVKTAITNPIQTALDVVRTAITKIKSIINGAHLSLPHFKLPHFRITGGKLPWGIGGKGVKPTINVDWYAKGGIFNGPTLAGIGEAGPEAVVPLDKFWDKLDNMSTGSTNIVININGANRDPRDIADEVRRMLIKETNQRRLAWQ